MNNLLCGFQKAHNTQHALFKLIQPWQQVLDNGGFIGTILMDLSKAYDCIPHNLLLTKLECYGVDKASLKFLLDYLARRKQRTKISSSFSSWCGINIGELQGSILDLLLFDISINDFFSIKNSEVCNLADDHTLFSADKNLDHVFFNLSSDLSNVMDWFKINFLEANPGKFQYMVLGANKNDFFSLIVAVKIISSSSEVHLLEITTNNE